jgi:transposase InsO family protein
MRMSYTTNEKLPEIRMKAVLLLRKGWPTRKVARHFGFSQSAIVKWSARAPRDGRSVIETRSSAPKTSPRSLPKETVGRIINARIKSRRCAEVVYEMLKAEGVAVSLSSVKRKLSTYGLLKRRSLWKRRRVYPPRPEATTAGMLVQMDTIHFVDKDGKRIYVYTALDVYSRYGFATLSKKSNCHRSISFLKKAIGYFPFNIQNIQTDNGPEFGLHFTDFATRHSMAHRHIHPRSPNENGHLERFNRTIQEEIGRFGWCIFIPKDIRAFLRHYNTERLHMGINFKTPAQLV